jgi:hypothetical protein
VYPGRISALGLESFTLRIGDILTSFPITLKASVQAFACDFLEDRRIRLERRMLEPSSLDPFLDMVPTLPPTRLAPLSRRSLYKSPKGRLEHQEVSFISQNVTG